MMEATGYIPPSERTMEQWEFHRAMSVAMGDFGDVSIGEVDVPDRIIAAEVEKQLLGMLTPRVWQVTGSCVGAGGHNAHVQAQIGDVAVRKDRESIKSTFWLAPYGISRKLGGMNGPGEGSFGSALAAAVSAARFGLLPHDHPGVPQPEIIADGDRMPWIKFDGETERTWSWPGTWTISEDELREAAREYGIETVAQAHSLGEIDQALAQLFGVTLASMCLTISPKVRGGLLVGDWDRSGGHQVSIVGRIVHGGKIWYAMQNQWGPKSYPVCPILGAAGVTNAAWWEADMMQRILNDRNTEIFMHSNTMGFPKREIDWDDIWQYED